MKMFRIKLATLLIALFALVGGPFLGTASAASDDDVVVCELAYYTGEFASYGPYLTASLSFPIDNVINADPPLGRTWDLISEDIGTVGEGQAARTCLEDRKSVV